MHWITVQAIFGVSKYCPKTILIDEKLIKVRIYLKTVWHFTMIVAFCIEWRYLYLMNMEICVRIIGDVVIISVKPWCNICTVICYVTFDTLESSGFRVHHWYDFQSLSNIKSGVIFSMIKSSWVNLDSVDPNLTNMRISPNGTIFDFFVFSFLKNTLQF